MFEALYSWHYERITNEYERVEPVNDTIETADISGIRAPFLQVSCRHRRALKVALELNMRFDASFILN